MGVYCFAGGIAFLRWRVILGLRLRVLFFDADGVELTLEPVGALLDGSTGNKIIQNPEGDILHDAPLGKYKISARYVPQNKPLKIRLRNAGQIFNLSVTSSFDPAYPGATGRYGLSVEVQPE